jgi:hypothetical protein
MFSEMNKVILVPDVIHKWVDHIRRMEDDRRVNKML